MSALIQWLRVQKNNRGVLAQLRCGLTPGKAQRAWPLLARFGGIEGHKGEVVRTVAALYASHPEETSAGGMGTLCKYLCSKDETPWTDEKPGPMATRLQYLLAAETPEVCPRVARMVLRAKSQGISVNYAGLFQDLMDWQWPEKRERVQARWAQEFWAPAATTREGDAVQVDADDMPPDLCEENGPEGKEESGTLHEEDAL